MYQNYSKLCLTMDRARSFAKKLIAEGCEDVVIVVNQDAFNQARYYVKWN